MFMEKVDIVIAALKRVLLEDNRMENFAWGRAQAHSH